jgi:hypothetical protein
VQQTTSWLLLDAWVLLEAALKSVVWVHMEEKATVACPAHTQVLDQSAVWD